MVLPFLCCDLSFPFEPARSCLDSRVIRSVNMPEPLCRGAVRYTFRPHFSPSTSLPSLSHWTPSPRHNFFRKSPLPTFMYVPSRHSGQILTLPSPVIPCRFFSLPFLWASQSPVEERAGLEDVYRWSAAFFSHRSVTNPFSKRRFPPPASDLSSSPGFSRDPG